MNSKLIGALFSLSVLTYCAFQVYPKTLDSLDWRYCSDFLHIPFLYEEQNINNVRHLEQTQETAVSSIWDILITAHLSSTANPRNVHNFLHDEYFCRALQSRELVDVAAL